MVPSAPTETAPMPQPESSIRHAIEWLYEDEALRSNLTDAAARHLLAWAEGHVRRAAQGDEATFRAGVNGVRQRLSEINNLVAARKGLSSAALRRRLASLPPSRALSAQANEIGRDQLAAQGARMADTQFVTKLLPLVDPLNDERAGAQRPAPPPHSPHAWAGGRANDARPRPRHPLPPPPKPRGCAQNLLPLLGLLLVAILLAGATAAYVYWPDIEPYLRRPTATHPALPPSSPSAEWYDIYFTTPGVLNPNGPDVALARLFDSATQSIDVASYELDREIVVQALLNAHARGVRVRVVTDIDILLDAQEGEAYGRLDEAGIPMVAGNSNSIMHNKFAVVDGATVWTGSWNFTDNDTERHNNHGIALYSPELAANYTATFLKMWDLQEFGPNRQPGGVQHALLIQGTPVENYFSPEDGVTAHLVERVGRAQRSVVFMAFSFTSDPIGDAMLERASRGVAVRGVFETVGSDTEYSEFTRLFRAGLDVRRDGNPYLMHHKVLILDETTVVLGSFNFSQNAERSNDENVLIIEDPALAARFLQEFQTIYAQARPSP